jgi:hypothetical protein
MQQRQDCRALALRRPVVWPFPPPPGSPASFLACLYLPPAPRPAPLIPVTPSARWRLTPAAAGSAERAAACPSRTHSRQPAARSRALDRCVCARRGHASMHHPTHAIQREHRSRQAGSPQSGAPGTPSMAALRACQARPGSVPEARRRCVMTEPEPPLGSQVWESGRLGLCPFVLPRRRRGKSASPCARAARCRSSTHPGTVSSQCVRHRRELRSAPRSSNGAPGLPARVSLIQLTTADV